MPHKDKLKAEDFAELLRDPLVTDALTKTFLPLLSLALEESFGKRIEALSNTVREVRSELTRVTDQCKTLAAENDELKKTVAVHDDKLEAIERYSRRDNIIISGLPENSYAEIASASALDGQSLAPVQGQASVEATVLQFFRDELNLDVSPRDIDVAHRIKSRRNDTCRPIIVRFSNYRIRNAVMVAKKGLRINPNTKDKIYLSEHLTANAQDLFHEARKWVKERKAYGAWTRNGEVYVKYDNDPATKGELIKRKSDLRSARH